MEQAGYEEFTAACNELVGRLTGISRQGEKELARLSTASRNHNRWLTALVISFVLVLVGGAVLGAVAYQESQTQNEVKILTDKQAARSAVLCPLYTIFIQADTPAATAASPPSTRAARAHAFDVIRDGYTALDCTPALDAAGHIPAPRRP